MKTASIGIVALLMMNAFAAAASAAFDPNHPLGQHDSALQPSTSSQDVLPLWGAPPGPYGPSNLTLLYKSPAFNGTPSTSKFANLDGDGDQDLVFCTVNETNKFNLSAIDTGTFSIMWSNVSLTSTGIPSIIARDFRGVGRDDLLISQLEGMGTLFTFIFGSNGTVGWTYSVSFTSGLFYGDINADGSLEFVIGLYDGLRHGRRPEHDHRHQDLEQHHNRRFRFHRGGRWT